MVILSVRNIKPVKIIFVLGERRVNQFYVMIIYLIKMQFNLFLFFFLFTNFAGDSLSKRSNNKLNIEEFYHFGKVSKIYIYRNSYILF